MEERERKVLCLINPRSGGNKGEQIGADLKALSKAESLPPLSVHFLSGQSLPPRAEIEAQFTDILVAGGDGTFSSILPEFVGSSLGFHLLALGTGNDLPRELGVRKLFRGSAKEFLLRSLPLPKRSLNVWRLQLFQGQTLVLGRDFLNYCSFGWDGIIVEEFDRFRKRGNPLSGKFGPWGNRLLYAASGILHPCYSLPKLKLAPREGQQGTEIEISGLRSLIFSNIQSVMGLGRTNAQSDFSDALLESVLIYSLADYFQMLLPFSLRSSRMRSPQFQSQDFRGSLPGGMVELPLQVDGEHIPQQTIDGFSLCALGSVFVHYCDIPL